jgi:RecB family exonuclease
MAEGAFPPRRLEDSLLPDVERAAAGGELALRAHRVHDDRRHLLAAVAGAHEAVLCQPRGDLRRSGDRPASRWLLRDAARLACLPTLRTDDLESHAAEPWIEHVSSFTVGLARTPTPATEQELRLAAVARGLPRHAVLTGDATLTRGLEALRARRSPAFTRFDGNLTAVAGDIGIPAPTSATRLQTWAACPHAYLLQYVLRVDPVEEPERRLDMTPLDKGSLVHEVLDAFVKDALRRGEPIEEWTAADAARLHLVADDVFARYEAEGRAGRALFWRRDKARIAADLERFLADDNARLARGVRPVATELEFDDLRVALPSGRVLTVRGSVDRIDRRADGSLIVLDYKTGKADDYRALSEENPHLNGTRLQLYLYALAVGDALPTDAPVWAGYCFNTTRGEFRQIGYTVTDAVAADVGGAIDTIVDGIANGVFPAHPAEQPAWRYVDCWYCTPDGLGATDRRRDWERKRSDPALAAYVALSEPGTLP